MIWTQGALPYSKVRYVRFSRPLFLFTPHTMTPKIFALSLKDPTYFELLIKNYKYVTQWPHIFDFVMKK